MADSKISNFPAATTLDGTELLGGVQSGANVKITALQQNLYSSVGSNIASATTTDIGAATGRAVTITGVTTITGLGTVAAGIIRDVVFSGVLTLTHNASSLILPGAANITTAAGDAAKFISLGSGNWRCLRYSRASGQPIATALTPTSISFTSTAGIIGTGTNDNAAAGSVGQYASSAVAAGSAVALTSSNAANMTSISLSAGDWDVRLLQLFTAGGSTSVSRMASSISQVSGTLDATPGAYAELITAAQVPTNSGHTSVGIPPFRVSLAGTTTIYAVAFGVFSVSTLAAWGLLSARRVR